MYLCICEKRMPSVPWRSWLEIGRACIQPVKTSASKPLGIAVDVSGPYSPKYPVLQYQNSERLECSASIRRVSRLFSIV